MQYQVFKERMQHEDAVQVRKDPVEVKGNPGEDRENEADAVGAVEDAAVLTQNTSATIEANLFSLKAMDCCFIPMRT